ERARDFLWARCLNLSLWDQSTGKAIASMHVAYESYICHGSFRGPSPCWTVSPDGRLLATSNVYKASRISSSLDSTLEVRKIATGKTLLKVQDASGIRSLRFSRDCRSLIAGDWQSARIFELASGAERRVEGPIDEDAIFSTRERHTSPDGRIQLQVDRSKEALGEIHWWYFGREDTAAQFPFRLATNGEHASAWTASLAIAPDAKHVALVSMPAKEKKPHLLYVKIESGKLVRDLGEHEADIPGMLLFSPDGEYLVSPTKEKIRRWRMSNGEELSSLPAKAETLVQFTPDSKTLAAADNCSLRIYDATSGKE